MDGDGAGLFFGINEITDERLDITVKDQTDDFAIFINQRAS